MRFQSWFWQASLSLIAAFSLRTAVAAPALTVDLHSHPFMNEGMGFIFNGDFNGPIRADSWSNLWSSQENPETLEESGIGILVVSLYAHPILSGGVHASIRRQIALAERFSREHPDWIIARSPYEARKALEEGRHVMVLALERASWLLNSESDVEEFIDRDGIRIVTLLHLADDENGGVAFLPGAKMLLNPLGWLDGLFHPEHDDGVRINPRGLTARGRGLLRDLLRHKVWVDLSHASELAQRDALPILRKAGQPLLYTHTTLRKYLGSERGIGEEMLEQVRLSRGIIGLLPSEEMLAHTAVPEKFCPAECKGRCDGGMPALATQFSEVAERLGPESVMFGTDLNGGIEHIKPGCGALNDLDRTGYWHVGQTPEVWDSLERLGALPAGTRGNQVEAFLEAWERAYGYEL